MYILLIQYMLQIVLNNVYRLYAYFSGEKWIKTLDLLLKILLIILII